MSAWDACAAAAFSGEAGLVTKQRVAWHSVAQWRRTIMGPYARLVK